jgi:hypothetical protein
MTAKKPTEGTWAAEPLTYGGTAQGKTRARLAVWYDEARTKLAFDVDRGRHYTVGGVYLTEVCRDAAGKALRRQGTPRFTGMHPDTGWVAALEADDYAAQQHIAQGQLERRAARDPEIAKVLGPVEDLAAGLNYAQRDALVAMLTRTVYRARAGKG